MNELPTIQEAQAARDSAFTTFECIEPQIKAAEAVIGKNSPAAAVAAGISLADAARAQAEGRNHLEFLHQAKDAAWQKVLDAEAVLKFAHVRLKWTEKLAAAIAARMAACEAHEAAVAAKEKAEKDYQVATETIAAAHAAGMPKPARLAEFPLWLGMTMNQGHQIVMRPAAEERAFWESAR